MGTVDCIIIAIVAILLAGAILYIVRSKKRGQRCVGCPDSGSCPHHCRCSDGNEKTENLGR